MSITMKRSVLIGLSGVWCALIAMRALMTEAPQEVPLTFVSGKPAPKTHKSGRAPDPWQVRRAGMQARVMPEGPKKNIFAPLGETMSVGAVAVVGKRATRLKSSTSPPVVAVVPTEPAEPSPAELTEQAARQQEELKLKQLREQMGQYRYLGYLSQQGVHKAFVGKGKDIYIIRKGDKLDGKFLVASIDAATVKLKEPATSLEASLDLKKSGEQGPS